ncbi:uncharacterized protein LOC110702672 [Chenopodium quinoa]|uniref:uncharacterized protein LOC110702672 n=1 Tax=Chenopodium quinoa TaxID=63459 RepID=UPI000B77BF14|nr:uncharacterized protein LOC110702672 [Chenopodium quinoa]
MSSIIYQILTSTTLLSLGLYHLISTTRNFLKSPQSFTSKPFHPLPLSSSHLRLLPLYFLITSLLLSFLHSLLSSSLSDPLIHGHSPVHLFTSLQSASISFLFLLLSLSLLLSESTSLFSLLPSDLFFALASASFFLSSSVSSSRSALLTSDLQSRCDSISSTISLISSILSLALAAFPRVSAFDVGLAASVCLQGLWALQTGLSLYVEAFIPEGCHRLLDVVSGVEGSTKCELEESKLRAVAILDFMFLIHVGVVVVLVFVVYAVVSKALGVSRRFGGSYEVLPTAADTNHVQLKTLTGTQA